MTPRVKLCAIAKNEGAYLADWVFHHLHFGFDAIEVWVNGSDDGSGRILQRISAEHPQVTRRNADRLLEECLSEGRYFQLVAYAKLARRARREGFTHVAFLDLDEYWTPRDFRSPVAAFLPEDPEVKVVSFPWCLDLPDVAAAPHQRPFTGPVQLQVQHHVKSVARMDGSIRKVLIHTFRINEGRRLLVRDPFPLRDVRAQKGGSFVTLEDLARTWHELPEAFVFHAINRSQREYLAGIAKGHRQSGREEEFKTNRTGYLPTDAPVLTFRPPALALRRYRRGRDAFLRGLDLDDLTERARRLSLERAADLERRLRADPGLREQLAVALSGTTLAAGEPSTR